ncbi:MAG: hypothetical protein QM541_16605 [Flavobacterium sp.]|nr:hypothetical protein [Flavobacterium sp.]
MEYFFKASFQRKSAASASQIIQLSRKSLKTLKVLQNLQGLALCYQLLYYYEAAYALHLASVITLLGFYCSVGISRKETKKAKAAKVDCHAEERSI